jgi:hypothetical protein
MLLQNDGLRGAILNIKNHVISEDFKEVSNTYYPELRSLINSKSGDRLLSAAEVKAGGIVLVLLLSDEITEVAMSKRIEQGYQDIYSVCSKNYFFKFVIIDKEIKFQRVCDIIAETKFWIYNPFLEKYIMYKLFP